MSYKVIDDLTLDGSSPLDDIKLSLNAKTKCFPSFVKQPSITTGRDPVIVHRSSLSKVEWVWKMADLFVIAQTLSMEVWIEMIFVGGKPFKLLTA